MEGHAMDEKRPLGHRWVAEKMSCRQRLTRPKPPPAEHGPGQHLEARRAPNVSRHLSDLAQHGTVSRASRGPSVF